jgi:hypothetical protein
MDAKGTIIAAGIFDKTARELYEMLYRYEFDYDLDSSKFDEYFDYRTPFSCLILS